MHLLVLIEGYRDQIENDVKLLEQKYYPAINPIDNKPTNYTAACREARLFDVVFPEVIKEDVLRDLGFYENKKTHRIGFLNWFLKFKPNGWFGLKKSRIQKNKELPFTSHMIVLAQKKDEIMPSGYEVV